MVHREVTNNQFPPKKTVLHGNPLLLNPAGIQLVEICISLLMIMFVERNTINNKKCGSIDNYLSQNSSTTLLISPTNALLERIFLFIR